MRSKLLVATAMAGTLALSTFGSAAAKGPHKGFQDLGNAAWAQAAIQTLATQGVLTGLTPTRFGPGQPVTIGQLAVVLERFDGGAPQGASFTSAYNLAIQTDITAGLGGSTPAGGAATRAQAITMIMNALHLQGPGDAANLGQFQDAGKVPGWARQPLAFAVQLGLLAGSNGYLDPDATLSRAELAVILERIEAELGLGQTAATVQGTYAGSGSTVLNGQPLATIALSVAGADSGPETYTIAPNAEIYDGNAPASLAQFQPGDPVMLTLNSAGQADVVADLAPVQLTDAHPGVVSGVVTAIGGGRITIADQSQPKGHGKKGRSASGTYALSPAVKVVIPGEGAHGSLAQIQTGAFVRLVVGPQGLVDLIIAQQLPATGGGTSTNGTPTGVSASETASGMALSWAGVSGASSYQVLEASGGAYTPVPAANGGTPTGTGTQVIGLNAGTSCTFEVAAVRASGTSAPSAPTAAVEWGAKPAASATVTVVTSGSYAYADISVTFDKPLNPATLDTNPGDYQVTDVTSRSALAISGITASGGSLTIATDAYPAPNLATDLLQATTGKSVVSDAAGAPTAPIDASGSAHLASPLSVSAQETAGGIYVGWTPIAGATSYQVLEASGGAYSPVATVNGGTSAGSGTQVTGLAAGQSYSFEVEAVTAAGTAAPSAPTIAVEWGAKSGTAAATTLTQVSGDESFSIAIPYDKALDASTLDKNLGDYLVTDLTTHQSLGIASVTLAGQTLVVQTALAAPLALTDTVEVETSHSVVNDTAGAPSTPITATGTL